LGLLKESTNSALAAHKKRRLQRMNMSEETSLQIEARIKERELVRSQKNFVASDAIRAELEGKGILVMDGPDGSTWTAKKSST